MVVVESAAERFENAGIVVHVIEDGILQAVASSSLPNSFATRYGGAPAALLDDLASNLAEAARQRRPIFEYDISMSPMFDDAHPDDRDRWLSMATTAIVDGDDVVGYVEVIRATNDRPSSEEFTFHERFAACAGHVIANADV